MSELKGILAKSAFWTLTESISLTAVAAITLLISARYLTPAEFGTASMALSVILIASTIVERLFHDSLIRPAEIDAVDRSSAHYATLVLALSLMAMISLIAGLFETQLGGPEVVSMIRWGSLSLLFNALSAVPIALLRREMRFELLAKRSMLSRLVASAVVIFLAMLGWGAWSLILQNLVMVGVSTLMLWGSARARQLRPAEFRLQAVKKLLGVGTVSTSLQFAYMALPRAFLVIYTSRFGMHEGGLLSFAFRLVDMLRDVLGAAASQLALPVFARVARDGQPLSHTFKVMTRAACLVGFPIFALLALEPQAALMTLFGEEWLNAATQVTTLSALCLYTFARMFTLPAFMSSRAPASAVVGLIAQVLFLGGALLCFPSVSQEITLLFWVARLAAALPADAYLMSRVVGIKLKDQLLAPAPPLLAAALATTALLLLPLAPLSHHGMAGLSIKVTLWLLIYALAIWFIDPKLITQVRSSISAAMQKTGA